MAYQFSIGSRNNKFGRLFLGTKNSSLLCFYECVNVYILFYLNYLNPILCLK